MNIQDHKDGGLLNDAISISTIGDVNAGGAHTKYLIEGAGDSRLLTFQNGDPADKINGISNEALLAILLHRYRGFQGSNFDTPADLAKPPRCFPCRENAIVITHLEEALMWMQKRQRDRVARGVQGKYVA